MQLLIIYMQVRRCSELRHVRCQRLLVDAENTGMEAEELAMAVKLLGFGVFSKQGKHSPQSTTLLRTITFPTKLLQSHCPQQQMALPNFPKD